MKGEIVFVGEIHDRVRHRRLSDGLLVADCWFYMPNPTEQTMRGFTLRAKGSAAQYLIELRDRPAWLRVIGEHETPNMIARHVEEIDTLAAITHLFIKEGGGNG